MSGGSYDYLLYKDSSNIFDYQNIENMEKMVQRLVDIKEPEAAREVEDCALFLRGAQIRIEARLARLNEVFRAVEWMDSGDNSEETSKEEIAIWREKTL